MAFKDEDIEEQYLRETCGTGYADIVPTAILTGVHDPRIVFEPELDSFRTENGFLRGSEGVWVKGAQSWEDDYSEDSRP